MLFAGLWLIDQPQWIKHLQEFRDWKHIVDLQTLLHIKLLRASDVSLKEAKTFPKSQDIFAYSKSSKSKYTREAQLGDTKKRETSMFRTRLSPPSLCSGCDLRGRYLAPQSRPASCGHVAIHKPSKHKHMSKNVKIKKVVKISSKIQRP